MALTAVASPRPEDPELVGDAPKRLTYDPTQSTGTTMWQMSLEHNRRLNAKGSQE